VIGGGSFIDGARMGAITVGLNHLAHYLEFVARNWKPTIFINQWVIPSGFSQEEYIVKLKRALIASGFNERLSIQNNSLIGRIKAILVGSPTASVTIKDFRLGVDRLEAGGYASLNDPNSIVIYNGLSTSRSAGVPMWAYVNATLHEIGHALFGFSHDSVSIMDYQRAYRYGTGFVFWQKQIISQSIWGR